MRGIMVKIALERNTCEQKALLSSIACDLFCVDLSTELGHATRVTNQSNFVERNVLVRNRQLARDVRVMRETLVLPQLIRPHIFSACEQRQRAPS
jgi:hypothetical protein